MNSSTPSFILNTCNQKKYEIEVKKKIYTSHFISHSPLQRISLPDSVQNINLLKHDTTIINLVLNKVASV